jgi:hypothetical protein
MATKKSKKSKWFIAVRGSYLPANKQGWLTYIPYLSFLFFSFILAWDINVHRVVKAYLVVVQWAFAALLMTVVARKHS